MKLFTFFSCCQRCLLTFLLSLLWLTPAGAQRPKVGLALGGGGAKGAATVGVLKVIEEAGIPIDYIAGTSIGAIVGGLYATGYSAAELDSIFRSQTWLSLLTDRREDLAPYPFRKEDEVSYLFGYPIRSPRDEDLGKIGMLRGQHIEQMLDSLMGFRGFNEFESLKIPFCCVATDFHNAREVVLSSGFPATAMRASMAIPGVFRPVIWEEMSLVDGGMMNNLPVDVVRKMGADIVIAIDLQQAEPEPRTKEHPFAQAIGDLLGFGPLVRWATEHPEINKYLQNREDADIYIHPILTDYDVSSFDRTSVETMLELGEEAGHKQWKQLKALKKQLKE